MKYVSMDSHRYDDSNRSKETPDKVIVCAKPISTQTQTHTHTNKSMENKNLQNKKFSLGADIAIHRCWKVATIQKQTHTLSQLTQLLRHSLGNQWLQTQPPPAQE